MIVNQPAPRLWAASVRLRMSMARRPVSTARYMYGQRQHHVAGDEQERAPDVGVGERNRRLAVDADQTEDEDDRAG